jgi:hypothetical protein
MNEFSATLSIGSPVSHQSGLRARHRAETGVGTEADYRQPQGTPCSVDDLRAGETRWPRAIHPQESIFPSISLSARSMIARSNEFSRVNMLHKRNVCSSLRVYRVYSVIIHKYFDVDI